MPSALETACLRIFMGFMKTDFKKAHQGGIQGVDPENRLIRVIDMLVPGPIRIGKKVAFLHVKRLTFNYTVSSLALNDEPHPSLSVAMGDCVFAGLKHLNIELKSVSRCALRGLHRRITRLETVSKPTTSPASTIASWTSFHFQSQGSKLETGSR